MNDEYENLTRDELLEMIRELKEENVELKQKLANRSWVENPDRMGGQFTEEEKNHRNFY